VPSKPVTATAATRRPALVANKDKTEASASTRAVDAAKRKRDALGELTNKSKAKAAPKDKDGKPLGVKPKDSLHKRSESMPSTTASAKHEETMDVDGAKAASEETDTRPRFSRRISARTVSASAPAQPSAITVAQVAGRRVVSAAATRALRAASHARAVSAQVSESSVPSAPVTQGPAPVSHRTTPEDDSDGPAHKRRRTSSLDAEEASRAVAQVNEKSARSEAIEVDEPWTDLDKDDEGDPLMVSEYVIDIFNYMKQIEVSFFYPYRSRKF
jgi:hypothetical protein